MNPEIIQLKGQLAEAHKKYTQLDLEASGLILLVRQLLNPYEDDITRLRIPEAKRAMDRLEVLYNDMVSVKKKISALEEALGG